MIWRDRNRLPRPLPDRRPGEGWTVHGVLFGAIGMLALVALAALAVFGGSR